MADKIKVALNGYGTIGKRVADAVMRQDDMTLVGIAKTKPDYEAYVANKKGYPIYAVEPAKAESKFKAAGISHPGLQPRNDQEGGYRRRLRPRGPRRGKQEDLREAGQAGHLPGRRGTRGRRHVF